VSFVAAIIGAFIGVLLAYVIVRGTSSAGASSK
jgi:ABC-type sulfate transport system permease component